MDACANCSTINLKLPLEAALLAFMVATFSSEDEPVKPVKLESLVIESREPRKASNAA
ncbi:hypothetical protein D3C73_1543030 [compost metagenome]